MDSQNMDIQEEINEEIQDAAEEAVNEEVAEEETEAAEENASKEKNSDKMSWSEKKASKKQEKKEKKDKADAYKEQIDQLEDRVKRQMAEFDNFRKRSEKEKAAMFETGAKSVIEKILPVVDNFERGLASVPEDKKEDPFVDGMNRTYKQLLTELAGIGVEPIEALGTPFDPNFHNAVMQVESEEDQGQGRQLRAQPGMQSVGFHPGGDGADHAGRHPAGLRAHVWPGGGLRAHTGAGRPGGALL